MTPIVICMGLKAVTQANTAIKQTILNISDANPQLVAYVLALVEPLRWRIFFSYFLPCNQCFLLLCIHVVLSAEARDPRETAYVWWHQYPATCCCWWLIEQRSVSGSTLQSIASSSSISREWGNQQSSRDPRYGRCIAFTSRCCVLLHYFHEAWPSSRGNMTPMICQ